MVRAKGTTPKALQFHFKIKQQEGTTINNNGGESESFRLFYYGDASAGSVPFMWESHPGTPKHATTQSYLPHPLTPPPAFHQNTTSLRTLFLDASFRKSHVEAASASDSSISYDSSRQSRTSLRSLFLASSSRKGHVAASPPPPPPVYCSLPSTPVSKGHGKTEFRRRRVGVGVEEKHVGGGGGGGGGDGSPAVKLCFGGGLMRVCRIKKVKNALMAIGGPR